MDTTTAIIQFIGIVLFSAQIPNDPGVHAIVPRIEHHTHTQLNYSKVSVKPNADATGVEDHVAVIIYREQDRLHKVGGWRPDGALRNGWEYVRLNGEHVQFLSNGANAAPAIPNGLPRVTSSDSCLTAARQPQLLPTFQAPYKGAAGVIDIPSGRLDVCAANSRGVTERVDTRLLINSEGVLVIAATKTGEPAKTIALDGDAVVYVANVPPYFLFTGVEKPAVGDPHYEAYNAMLDSPCASRPQGELLPESCDLTPISESYRIARNEPPADFKMINSECSNTQWP